MTCPLRSAATKAGLERARAAGRRLGRPRNADDDDLRRRIAAGELTWHIHVATGASVKYIRKIRAAIAAEQQER